MCQAWGHTWTSETHVQMAGRVAGKARPGSAQAAEAHGIGRWAGCGLAGGVEDQASDFSRDPYGLPLTHQHQPGSGRTPSGRPLGANAAPHSPPHPARWAPPRSRAAAGPAEGPSPGHPPWPARGWAGGQSNGRPELPTACLACLALSTGRMGVPHLPSPQGQVSSCACAHIPQRVVALPFPPLELGHSAPGPHRTHLGSALRPISQKGLWRERPR